MPTKVRTQPIIEFLENFLWRKIREKQKKRWKTNQDPPPHVRTQKGGVLQVFTTSNSRECEQRDCTERLQVPARSAASPSQRADWWRLLPTETCRGSVRSSPDRGRCCASACAASTSPPRSRAGSARTSSSGWIGLEPTCKRHEAVSESYRWLKDGDGNVKEKVWVLGKTTIVNGLKRYEHVQDWHAIN